MPAAKPALWVFLAQVAPMLAEWGIESEPARKGLFNGSPGLFSVSSQSRLIM
jgi:hypothetical protein